MITSPANAHVKLIRLLATNRKERARERLFVLEGVRLISDARAAQATLPLLLYEPEQLASTPAGATLLAQIADLPQSYPATARVLAAATATVTPQGVVALAQMPQWDIAQLGQRAASAGPVLVLDTLQDPGNAGTLLRSAVAAGVRAVLSTIGTVDLYSPKVVRAGMSAHFALPLLPDLTWAAIHVTLHTLLGPAPLIYAADMHGDLPYYAADWLQPAALIIGNEAHGISAAARAAASQLLSIPMCASTESLNAAIAGSVILFEALRQRRVA